MLPSTSKSLGPSGVQAKHVLPPGYPRRCAYCNSKTEYYDAAEFGRHLRVAHSTKEGGSFVCKYGENGVCPKLPPEGVSDYDYEAHIRKFHTASEIASRGEDSAERAAFTINSSVQNLASALCDPSRSRSETGVFFTRHWGDAYTAAQVAPPSAHLRAIAAPTLLAQLERNLKTYKKFAHTKRTLKKQRAQALEDERADVDDLPKFLVTDSFDLSAASSFSALFIRPSLETRDPLADAPITRKGKSRSTNPFDESDDSPDRRKGGKNPFIEETPPGKNPFDGPEWRDRGELQSRLETMHDAVDARLASRLRAKSDAFWRIVNSYGGLQKDIQEARVRIGVIRKNLSTASTSICERTMRMQRLAETREEKRKLLSKLHDMACLREAQSAVQALLSRGEFPRALECISTSSEVVDNELAGVTAFRHLAPQLAEMRSMIGRMMKEELATLIQKEFGSRSEEPGQIRHEGELLSVMLGLAQLGSFSFVAMLKSEIAENTRLIVRNTCKACIVSFGEVDALDPSRMGDAVRRLRFKDWLTLLECVQGALFSFQLRIEALQSMVVDLLDRVWPDGFPDGEETSRHSPTPTTGEVADDSSGSDIDQGEGDSKANLPTKPSSAVLPVDIRSLSQLRRSLCCLREYSAECAHSRLVRIIVARDATATLPTIAEVSDQTKLINDFMDRGTERGWGRGRTLEAAIEKSTVEFVEKLHRRRKETVCQVLDRELWKPAEVLPSIQHLVNRFDEGDEGGDDSPVDPDGPSLPGSAAPSVVGESSTLLVEGTPFVVVGSSLLTVSALHEHLSLARSLPSLASRILMRTVELLKAFNSRACQLILGAGALQLVGLKTISVKNLALASRSLQLVSHFIPVLEKNFDPLLQEGDKGMLRYFQKVRIDYTDHVNEIVAKLISVIEHHSTNCLSSWSVGGAPPSPAIQTLCKQLAKFHAGLYGIMADDQIRGLFSCVHGAVVRLMQEALASMKITPQDVLAYGIVCEDYSFYARSIHSMAGCEQLQLGTAADVLHS